MSYAIVRFGDVTLPDRVPTDDLSTGEVASTLRASIGRDYDSFSTLSRKPRRHILSHRGKYLGEIEYVVDETGDRLVDETGDYVIAGDAEQMLHAQLFFLKEKLGQRDRLYRQREDDGILHWKMFRLLDVRHLQGEERVAHVAELECTFESAQGGGWRAETATSYDANVSDGVTATFVVENGGLLVEDALVAVYCTSGTITAFRLICTSLGIDWVWTGSLETNDVLTFDTGAQTAKKILTDAYSGFSLAGHTARGWLPLPRGTHLFTVTVLGGDALVAVEYYTQYP